MNENEYQLGHLKKVNPRKVWDTEDRDFTPWLAQEENLKLLGDTIGFELELEAQEKNVGPFRADILCKDTISENWVLIENQLEKTDHKHLGQLLTYAAGLKAVTIIWIANPFTDEHRAALDWLNDITDDRFNFFGLEIELWRIGNSPMAPKFNVICKPNDWARNVAAGASRIDSANLTDSKMLQQRYWTAFKEYVLSHDSLFKPTKPLPQHWMSIAIGRSNFKLTAIASLYDSVNETYDSNELRVELKIRGPHSKSYFAEFQSTKDQIEQELGFPLHWYNPEDTQACRLYIRKAVDIRNESDWPNQHEWMRLNLNKFYTVFYSRVRRLRAPETE